MTMGRLAAILLILIVTFGALFPAPFAAGASALLAETLASFGWFYLLAVTGLLIFMVTLAFGRHGNTRLGGEDATPDFSAATWFAMLFSAGMGIGLVFFGAAEPLSHYLTPPEGLEGRSPAAARAALRYAFFHQGLHPWAIYGFMGLAMAYARYNHGGSGKLRELLSPLLGRHSEGWSGKAVDLLGIIATVGGMATTLGYGAVQISSGLASLTGVDAGRVTQLAVIVIATLLFMVSASSGLQRGVKYLSNVNLVLTLTLLTAVFVLGPSRFILDSFTSTLGAYVNQLPGMSLRLTPFTQGTWAANWTIFYWAWWISWAPFVGSFIAAISRGRTLREFVVGVLLAPSLLGFLWFATFGATAIHQQMFEGVDLARVSAQGSEGVLFAVFEHLPFTSALAGLAVVLLMTFFVTSADSATLVIASMANEGKEPTLRSKLLWGALQPAIAVALLFTGGLGGLRAAAVVSALPFCFILVAMAWSLRKRLAADDRAHRMEEQRWRATVNALVDSQKATGASRRSALR